MQYREMYQFFFVTPPGGFVYIYILSNIRTITILHVPERDKKKLCSLLRIRIKIKFTSFVFNRLFQPYI